MIPKTTLKSMNILNPQISTPFKKLVITYEIFVPFIIIQILKFLLLAVIPMFMKNTPKIAAPISNIAMSVVYS